MVASRWPLLLLVVVAAMLAFTALDVREVLHQDDGPPLSPRLAVYRFRDDAKHRAG